MRGKVAVIVLGVLVFGLSWVWFASETLQHPGASELPEAEAPESAGPGRPGDPRRERSPEIRTVRESSALPPSTAPSTAPSESPRKAADPFDDGEPARAVWAGKSRDRRRDLDDREPDSDRELESDKVGFPRFKEVLVGLRDLSRGGAAAGPIDASSAGLSAEDVERLDLNDDGSVSPWEVSRSLRLLQRAERHPLKNDFDDGAYPTAREDYKRDWEFEVVDTDRDGVMTEEEYYSFLALGMKESVLLDSDGDWLVSLDESGLREDDFGFLDIDDSGSLKMPEIRRGIALGILKTRSE